MFQFILPAIGALASLFGSKKASDAAKLDPQTLAYQNEAMRLQNARMQMLNPLLEQLVGGMSARLPASYGGAAAAPTAGQMRTPGTGQAVSRLARSLPGPQQRKRYPAEMR